MHFPRGKYAHEFELLPFGRAWAPLPGALLFCGKLNGVPWLLEACAGKVRLAWRAFAGGQGLHCKRIQHESKRAPTKRGPGRSRPWG